MNFPFYKTCIVQGDGWGLAWRKFVFRWTSVLHSGHQLGWGTEVLTFSKNHVLFSKRRLRKLSLLFTRDQDPSFIRTDRWAGIDTWLDFQQQWDGCTAVCLGPLAILWKIRNNVSRFDQCSLIWAPNYWHPPGGLRPSSPCFRDSLLQWRPSRSTWETETRHHKRADQILTFRLQLCVVYEQKPQFQINISQLFNILSRSNMFLVSVITLPKSAVLSNQSHGTTSQSSTDGLRNLIPLHDRCVKYEYHESRHSAGQIVSSLRCNIENTEKGTWNHA